MTEKTAWTPGLDARLRELHGLGLIYSQIAKKMNEEFDTELTRNACIGRGRRIGLSMRGAPPPPRQRKKQVVTRKARPYIKKQKPPEAPPIVPEVLVLIPGQLTMLQLDRTTCRWPSGTKPPYFYCGEAVLGDRPYCRKHCAASYQRPEKTWQ